MPNTTIKRNRDDEYTISYQPSLIHGGARRGVVGDFSASSRRRMLVHLKECAAVYVSLGTLTYPADFADAGNHKKHIRAFAERCKRKFWNDTGFSLFWFLEFTKKGIPHYHFFANRFLGKLWLGRAWYAVVGTARPEHLLAGTRIEFLTRGEKGARSYAAKYASKFQQKELSNLPISHGQNEKTAQGRWWGVIGDRSVVAADIVKYSNKTSTYIEINKEIACIHAILRDACGQQKAKRWSSRFAQGFSVSDDWTMLMIGTHFQRIKALVCLSSAT